MAKEVHTNDVVGKAQAMATNNIFAAGKEEVETKAESTKKQKDKAFSGRMNSDLYERFTKINQGYGMTNNSVINMLVAKYVKEEEEK